MSTIYIHWPFCVSKCHYCDFNSIACKGSTIDFENWLKLYKKILLKFKDEFYKGERVTSVYFGGGTPSLLPVFFVEDILNEIRKNFNLTKNAEITLEANPKTIDKEKAAGLKKSGINRLSIGVQSIIDSDLKMLGRIHSAKDAIDCVYEMRNIFENISIHMRSNTPGQTIEKWINELNEALKLPIDHISLYELIVEDNTPIKKMIDSGMLPIPSSSADFFEKTMEITSDNNFEMYEVSNFALNKFANQDPKYGKHNLSYWNYEDYYGIGPGSHSRVSVDSKKIAIAQNSNNASWLKWAENESDFDCEILSKDDEYKERLIMGLRANCGIDLDKIEDTIKNKYDLEKKLKNLTANSYIIKDGGKVFLTREGIFRLNMIVKYLAGE